ncbi:MAG: cyanophycin synthetase [Candidatus Hydrothermia bacterium]|nr:Mur ligase family protein [Candidatus Hydrothermia bacterium]MDD5572706.1 Mur ligase family protein [Candidatus Hydrothermia bacterium]HOK22587.1 Mur ligase family protein [Candidatus Hydrothermia bacterium]HOL23294.1 Mur ligase family protein [Candidatus Hydrothermia bacterium]HPO78304.1 Mur ligase family protein [Candidatus Hydrothermia bacterium]
MEFNAAVEYLNSLIDYERKRGYVDSLDGFLEFLSHFENPQTVLPNPILIVGTKGKGSTAHLIAGGLESLGFKVGLYTSPHLVDIRERIRINGKKIPEDRFCTYLERIRPYIEERRGIRTVFETLTLMAFLYFNEERVDYSVLEAGLGGRLDATNVVNQILTIITSISYDHMEILGNKLTQIATEKAAVVKNRNPVVVAPQHSAVYKVIGRFAEKQDARTYFLNKCVKYSMKEATLDHTVVKYRGLSGKRTLVLNQAGTFQAKNMALSALALETLGFSNFSFDKVHIEGRFEVISKDPLIIIDGAHNVASVKNLLHAVNRLLVKDYVFIFGVNRDKEVKRIVREIVSHSNPRFTVLTCSKSPRATRPEELLKIFTEEDFKEVCVKENSDAALHEALLHGNRIVVFGSFYLAGEIKETVLNVSRERNLAQST